MRGVDSRMSGRGWLILLATVLLVGASVRAASATAGPVGACCLANGQCQSLNQFDCDAANGDFIGPDTSCVMIECPPPAAVGAPVLSILGLVAAVGALVGLALYRFALRRTPPRES
jgi:hypothetical protein